MPQIHISSGSPIVVFAHVHYPDIWREMAQLLIERMNVPFRLVLTSSHAREQVFLPDSSFLVATTFLQVENRGRDILPFLHALSAAGDFEIGLKLHTKKSPQRSDGFQWRTEVLDNLLPLEGGVSDLLASIVRNRRIGMVAPAGFCLSVRPWIFINGPGMERVMKALGHDLIDADFDGSFFSAGSMFWFRWDALASLTDAKVTMLFEEEEGQFDGTVAHALERLFGVEAKRQGFATLSTSALALSRPEQSYEELISVARDHADIPNIYFPAPGISAGASPNMSTEQNSSMARAIFRRIYLITRAAARRILKR